MFPKFSGNFLPDTNSVVNKDLTLKAKDLTLKAKDLTLKAKDLTSRTTSNRILTPQFNLSVESNQNVESKRKSVESKN